MRVDHYRKLVDVDCCLRDGTQKKRKGSEAVRCGSSPTCGLSLIQRFVSRKPWYCFFNRSKRSFKDTSGTSDFLGESSHVQITVNPLSVSGAGLQVASNRKPLEAFLSPFCSSARGSSLKVEATSFESGGLYWFLNILCWITRSFLVFCVVGKLYLWYYPLLPPELVWIDGFLVEVVEQETWLESYWKWTSTWLCLCFTILLTIIVSHCSFLLDVVSLLVPRSPLESDVECGSPFAFSRKKSSSSSSRCRNGVDEIGTKNERAGGVCCHPTSSSVIHPDSTFSSTSQCTLKMPSLVGCCSYGLQPFARTFSRPPIRSAKDLDRFVNGTQATSVPFERTPSTPLEKDFLSMKPLYSCSAAADNSLAMPDKNSLANKSLPFFRPLRDNEEKRGSTEVHKRSTRLAWGNPNLHQGGRSEVGTGGDSLPANESPLLLAGRGLEGGISVRYDGRDVTEGSPGVSRNAFPSESSKNITFTGGRTRSQQDKRNQLHDTDGVGSRYGANGAVWAALGLMDAFLVRSAMVKVKERFQQICVELLKRIEESNVWFRACNLADFDCSHSLEETYTAPQTAGFGGVGSFRSGIGSSTLGSGAISSFTGGGGMFSSGGGGGAAVVGFGSNTAASGFGQSTTLLSGTTALSGGQAGPSLTRVTKKMYLFQEKEKLRQQAAAVSVGAGAGGFGNSTAFRPSVGFTSPSPPQTLSRGEMIEKIQRFEERLELDEKLNVFLTFPLSTVTGSAGTPSIDRVSSVTTPLSGVGTADCARCQQQQQYLIHRMQTWASSSSWNPRDLSPEKSPNEAVGAAAVSEIWHERDGDQHSRGSGVLSRSRTFPLVENDAYLMLHLLRCGIDGLSSFVRSGYLSSSSRVPELSLCVGDVGIPYFYVLFRTSAMDIPLSSTLESNDISADAGSASNRVSGLRTLFPHQSPSFSSLTRSPVLTASNRHHVPLVTRNSGGGGRLSSGAAKTIRLNAAGWLKRLYSTAEPDNFEVDAMTNAISSSGVTLDATTEDFHEEEEEEVLLSTSPGPNSLWEALLLFICIVHRFYGGTFHSIQGVMDLECNGLISVVAPCTSVLHSRDESRKKRAGAATEPEGWLRGRSLFHTRKEIVV